MAKRTANTLSIMEVLSLFATESDAVKWFEEVRWNGTPTCTHCEQHGQPVTTEDSTRCLLVSGLSATVHRSHGHRDGIFPYPAPEVGRGDVLHADREKRDQQSPTQQGTQGDAEDGVVPVTTHS